MEGNNYARRKFALLGNLLAFTGVEPDRVQFSWISSAESTKFVKVANEVTDTIRALGPAAHFVRKRPQTLEEKA
jgi:F420-non-reducing hydrogenase iron-sulfur subunit